MDGIEQFLGIATPRRVAAATLTTVLLHQGAQSALNTYGRTNKRKGKGLLANIVRWWYKDPGHRAQIIGRQTYASERNRIRDDRIRTQAEGWAESLASPTGPLDAIQRLALTRHRLKDTRSGTRGNRSRYLASAMRLKFGTQRYSKGQYDSVRRWGSEQQIVLDTVVRHCDRDRIVSAALVLYFCPDDETLAHAAIFSDPQFIRDQQLLPSANARA